MHILFLQRAWSLTNAEVIIIVYNSQGDIFLTSFLYELILS